MNSAWQFQRPRTYRIYVIPYKRIEETTRSPSELPLQGVKVCYSFDTGKPESVVLFSSRLVTTFPFRHIMQKTGHGHDLYSSPVGRLFRHCRHQAVGLVAGLGLAMLAGGACADEASAPMAATAQQHCDVIVIGAGGSGLTSAVSAAEKGAKVIVVEKMPFIGGNTLLAASFMLGVPPGNRTEAERLESDMLREGGKSADPTLLKSVVTQSSSVVDWLRGYGADLQRFCLTRDSNLQTSCRLNDDGSVSQRGLQPGNGGFIGEEIIKTLLNGIEQHRIPIQTHSFVHQITRDADGRVNGVIIENSAGEQRRLSAPAVVIATGGFSANEDMIGHFANTTAGLQSTNSPAATGDGILMAEALGAETVDMDAVTVHPTTLPFSGLILPRQVRVQGAILVNDEGRRFADELSPNLSDIIRQKSEGRAWLIFDQALLDSMPVLAGYARSGYFLRGKSDIDLARGLRVSPNVLHETIVRYRGFVELNKDGEFNRRIMTSRLDTPPLYAVSVRPGIHTTLGGLKIDDSSRVLGKTGPIPGLFAAGEVTGGVLGANRLEGSGLTAALVYGRIAGQAAAQWAQQHALPTSSDSKTSDGR